MLINKGGERTRGGAGGGRGREKGMEDQKKSILSRLLSE